MTLKEYIYEQLLNYSSINEAQNDIFDYTKLQVDLIQIAEPAINFFKNNLEDEFFIPKKPDSKLGVLQNCPWTEWGWKAFMGEDGSGKGGIYYSKFAGNDNVLSAYFEPLLNENGLNKEALKSPEKKEEKTKDNSSEEENTKDNSSEEEKTEDKPKGEGKKLSDLEDSDKKDIALMMLDGEVPKVVKENEEDIYYLDDKQPLDDEYKTLMKNRIIFAILAKYLYEIYNEINSKNYKDKIVKLIGEIATVYLMLFVMVLKYDFDNVKNFTAFDENDIIGKIINKDDNNSSTIRDFCIITIAINHMLNNGLDETQISQLINLTGLLSEK